MLHDAHPGMSRMKSLARSYLWWPGMDKAIEDCVRECSVCQSTRKDPPAVPLHPWSWPEKPWTRIHIDYAGPLEALEGKMFLLISDAHSKWLDIHQTNSSTSLATIELLRRSFATLGLPETVVSDNATAFTSSEFAEFLSKNGIRHIRTPPYHPASNGLVERAVQTFKEGMKRIKEGSLNTRLSRFLFQYRLTPHSSTGVSPAELMFGRKLRSQLDLLKPSVGRTVRQEQDRQKKAHDAHASPRSFVVGDYVYARNYRDGPRWLPGRVVETEGSVLTQVKLTDGHLLRRHMDQLRPRATGPAETIPVSAAEEVPQSGPGGETVEELELEIPSTSPGDTEQPPETHDMSTNAEQSNDAPDTTVDQPSSNSSDAPAEGQSTVRRSARTRHPPERFDELNL